MSKVKSFISGLFVFCLSLSFSAHAQPVIVDSAIKGSMVLSAQDMLMYADSSKRLTIENILQNPPKFTPNTLIHKQLSGGNITHWLKLNFKNTQNLPARTHIALGYISWIDVYVVSGKKITEHIKEGTLRPTGERKTKAGAYTRFVFRCPAKQSVTIYIKARAIGSNPIWLSPEIMTNEYQEQLTQNRDLGQGIFHGLLWMMLFYSIFMYVSLKDITYLHYAGYISCTSIFFLFFHKYITNYIPFFGSHPQLTIYFSLVLYVAFLFYYMLMRRFNNLEQTRPKADRFMVIWIRVNASAFVIGSILININLSWFYTFNDLFNTLAVPVLLLFLAILARTGNLLSRYFFVGSMFVIFGGVIMLCTNLMGIPAYKTGIYFQAGVLIEIFIFALGLSMRFKLNQKETHKAQNELIEQLRHNEELQANYAHELEATVEERTAELQNAYTNITDSVHYAQRIQQSVLAHPHDIARHFRDSFIFFEPKDIVSGDFYWFAQHDKELIIAAIDCTGHGVPGAFMTIMGNDFLNEIVEFRQISQPSEILEELDKKITLALQKQSGTTDINDGMDMAILNINYETNTVQYAGAKNPLWYVSNGEMNIIKASKFPIGSAQYKETKVFVNHWLPLQKGDIFYIFSDGFQDQFGGKLDKKYMKRNFRELLLKVSSLPLKDQHKQLQVVFEEWKQDTPQTDDVLIVGIKI